MAALDFALVWRRLERIELNFLRSLIECIFLLMIVLVGGHEAPATSFIAITNLSAISCTLCATPATSAELNVLGFACSVAMGAHSATTGFSIELFGAKSTRSVYSRRLAAVEFEIAAGNEVNIWWPIAHYNFNLSILN